MFLCALFAAVSTVAFAQNVISGKILDTAGKPVPGAIVKAESSSSILGYTTSDDKGRYSLSVERNGDAVVSVSCLGYETSSVALSSVLRRFIRGATHSLMPSPHTPHGRTTHSKML